MRTGMGMDIEMYWYSERGADGREGEEGLE